MTLDEATMLHLDLDAFFASVEQILDPSLSGRPVIVGGLGGRGVVSAASYEARRFGVHSAMPMVRARRACPEGVFLAPRFAEYERYSRSVMALLRSVTPAVEPLSIDEAFLDVAGARRMYGAPAEIGALLRERIRAETGLTASVGAATTKFLAKVASDMAKPDGMIVVAAGSEDEFLRPLPVERLWGVGPATLARLDRMGVRTVGEVAEVPLDALVASFGSASGRHLHALAHNVDERSVQTHRVAKSIGAEETFSADLTAASQVDRELVRLADRVASRVRSAGVAARTVTVKVRYSDFETVTRARTVDKPADTAAAMLRAARALVGGIGPSRGIRLLGLHVSRLMQPGPVQSALDLGGGAAAHEDRARREAAIEGAVDEVRARFGVGSVGPATLLSHPEQEGGGAQGAGTPERAAGSGTIRDGAGGADRGRLRDTPARG